MYVVPRMIGVDLGRKCVQFKLVGNLFHGHVLVLHLVHPNVPDDSNLMCHCLDTALEELVKVRVSKDQPDFFTPNHRSQLDGVSTNWGMTSFAHHEFLQRKRVLGERVDVVRNKVGSTHEDIDALFGTGKEHLKNVDCATPQELVTELRKAFSTYKLPVVILEVDATLDYKSFYAEHVDPKLEGFGCVVHIRRRSRGYSHNSVGRTQTQVLSHQRRIPLAAVRHIQGQLTHRRRFQEVPAGRVY